MKHEIIYHDPTDPNHLVSLNTEEKGAAPKGFYILFDDVIEDVNGDPASTVRGPFATVELAEKSLLP